MSAYKIFNKLFDEQHIREHYEEKIIGSYSVGVDKITPEKFDTDIKNNIEIINRKVNNGTYKFSKYKQVLISKGVNKYPRVICVPTIRDKLTASILNECLIQIFGQKAQTPLPHIIIKEIVDSRSRYDKFIKIDISSFYSSIDHSILLKKIKTKIRKKEIINLITNAIESPAMPMIKQGNEVLKREKGVPEGLSFSNVLANLYLLDIDEKYQKKEGINCFRYVDDILILTKEKYFDETYREICSDLKKLNLAVNEKEDSGDIRKSFSYLGYLFTDDAISVKKSNIYRLEQSLESIFRSLNNNKRYLEWKLNLRIAGFKIGRDKYGWMFFYSQMNDMKLLYHLDSLVLKLAKRYKIENLTVKRFVRTYHEIKNNLSYTKYIPNLDDLSTEKKRSILTDIYNKKLVNTSDMEIDRLFKKVMLYEIRDIEKDIQNIS